MTDDESTERRHGGRSDGRHDAATGRDILQERDWNHTTIPDHTAIGGVHTFSVVPAPGSSEYFGYAGPLVSGPIDLWRSSDLKNWTPYPENPILETRGLRWPSVLYDRGWFHMVVRGGYDTPGRRASTLGRLHSAAMRNQPLFAAERVYERLRDIPATSIDLYVSRDGVSFERKETLVERFASGNRDNHNPFLFRDPRTDEVAMVYYSGDRTEWQIRCRTASTVPALSRGEDRVVLSSSRTLAAPAVFYHPTREQYCLLAEELNERNEWITTLYVSDDLSSGFHTSSRHVLFDDDEACPFPFVDDRTLHLFVSKRLHDGMVPRWQGRIHRLNLR